MGDEQKASKTALGHLRVVEVGGAAAAGVGMWLVGLGAEVIKVEPPDGDPMRMYPPFAGDIEDRERSVFHLHFNRGKKSIVLDTDNAEDADILGRLIDSADILVDAFPRRDSDKLGLDGDILRTRNPRLVSVSVSPFGREGTNRDYQGDDLISLASSGYMAWAGDNTRPPVVAPAFQGWQLGGLYGALASLLALRDRSKTGLGQSIDLSIQQALAHSYGIIGYIAGHDVVRRIGVSSFSGHQIYACADGYLLMSPFSNKSWQLLAQEWMEDPLLSQEDFLRDRNYRTDNTDVIDALIKAFTAKWTKWEFVMEAQRRHIQASPLNTPADFIDNDHTKQRGLIVDVDHPVVGKHKMLKAPLGLTETPWAHQRSAPLLDVDREDILSSLPIQKIPIPTGVAQNPKKGLPLEGIRILDFTRVRSGPMGTAVLSDYGADCIRIQSNTIEVLGAAGGRMPPHFDDTNRTKKSIELNLKTTKAKEIFFNLVKQSDVVVENFTYMVMDNLGIGYEDLRKVKPDIILASMPPMGKSGPFAGWTTYGQQLMAFSGMSYLWGHSDAPMEAHAKIPYPDDSAAAQMVFSVLAALEHRDRTGEGQFIEVAQGEGLAYQLSPVYLDYLINGRNWTPRGNWHPIAAPFGVYPAVGFDKWVAISCETEAHWQGLVKALEQLELLEDGRFATREARRENAETLDGIIMKWTQDRTAPQAAWGLQYAGVPAYEVMTNEDVYHDTNLRARKWLQIGDFPGWPNAEHRTFPVFMSELGDIQPTEMAKQGQHNHEVLGSLLGIPKQTVDRLIAEKVVY
jgi:crotonobetainyl-CoA:carnitine CoA-transferase CaiB-like acyl-CoA transferase